MPLKPSLLQKLQGLNERFEELQSLLSTPEVVSDNQRFRDYSKEYAQLEPLITAFQQWQRATQQLTDAESLLSDPDPELKALANADVESLSDQLETLEQQLQILLLPKDPDDHCNVFLEVRAGTGGDEAAIFAGDLMRMYHRYAEKQGWQVEVVSASEGEHGGYKEVILKISGTDIYSHLKFESGAHRVQRVPVTESQGRIHTSACTVAVLPEVSEVEAVEINQADIKTDTFRASGAGGQHVNKTDSAIRITHLPTGIVVECQEERSQHKNRAKALSLLQARITAVQREKQQAEQAATRKSLVGSGDRSERIRTYNYPQSRVTDHRINLTLYKLPEIMEGELSQVVDPLVQEHQAQLLAEINEAHV